MHRLVVVVVAALLLVALGASLGMAKDEDEEKRKVIAEVILLSGEAREGERALREALKEYRAPGGESDAPQVRRKRRLEIIAQVEREMTAEAYAAYLAPLYEESLTMEEARQLAALLREPLLAKWERLQKELGPKRRMYRGSWEQRIGEEFVHRETFGEPSR